MKYLFIFALLAAVALFIYWRLRPYLKMARSVFGFMRDVRRMREGGPIETQGRQGGARAPAAAEKLVRCPSCATWFPASRAVSLRSSSVSYCSHDCLERAAANRAKAKSARR